MAKKINIPVIVNSGSGRLFDEYSLHKLFEEKGRPQYIEFVHQDGIKEIINYLSWTKVESELVSQNPVQEKKTFDFVIKYNDLDPIALEKRKIELVTELKNLELQLDYTRHEFNWIERRLEILDPVQEKNEDNDI